MNSEPDKRGGEEIGDGDRKAFMDRYAALERELKEQARLLGQSGSNEARLLARVAELEKERDAYRLIAIKNHPCGFFAESERLVDAEAALSGGGIKGNG